MAAHVVEKNVRNADANANSRLWNRLKPSSGNPKIFAPRPLAAVFIMMPDPFHLEYKFMASGAQIELWHAEKVATQVAVQDAPNGIRFAAFGETRVSDADLERLV